jgi:benzoyl-CoA reductase/2-hydroxyglutaryl-CoA dehydratase subunit BcrC/BadD/HgdB
VKKERIMNKSINKAVEPLLKDEFTGEPPTKRLLAHIQSRREEGKKVAGTYCGYAPMELIKAFDLVPATLCAFSNATIEAAETVLPANLCPLIKSSYGFIMKDSCPFFSLSDAIIAETTCDGKKKMFELISEKRPMYVMDLPQLPDEPEALDNWTVMINKLKSFLEKTFNTTTTPGKIEAAIKDSNKKTRLMNKVFSYAAMEPPVIGWKELYDILFLAQSATGEYMEPVLNDVIAKLDKRVAEGYAYADTKAPRVLVTGCPVAGDLTKVFSIIEDAGGVVVALDSCSGMKCYAGEIKEDTDNPIRAIAERYLSIPCSCMTPNQRRLDELDRLIREFKIDAVIDVVLQACHSYSIESHKVAGHLKKGHGPGFLKLVTDYSQGDVGQIRTRVEALLESCNK